MIRLGWWLVLLALRLLVICAEAYWVLWLGAWALALGARYPWITLPTALVLFVVNRQAVAAAKRKRQNWQAAFFGGPTP